MKFEYGEVYKQYPIETGVAVFKDGSRLITHDIFDELPQFMHDAEMIVTDGAWNTGNLRAFYTKAEIMPDYDVTFERFTQRLFECVSEISPKICYLEIGKEYLADYVFEMRKIYPRVTFFNSTYYNKKTNLCYVVRGSKKACKKMPLDGMDEAKIISYACEHEPVTCIGDLCMGRGLVALGAYANGKKFVGTELNHKRLSVTLERLVKAGAEYKVVEA